MGPRLLDCRSLLGIYHPFHAESGGRTRQAATTSATISHRPERVVDQEEDSGHCVRRPRLVEEPALCRSAAFERYWKRVVFPVDWTSWYGS